MILQMFFLHNTTDHMYYLRRRFWSAAPRLAIGIRV